MMEAITSLGKEENHAELFLRFSMVENYNVLTKSSDNANFIT
jgi:hypothetical protein